MTGTLQCGMLQIQAKINHFDLINACGNSVQCIKRLFECSLVSLVIKLG